MHTHFRIESKVFSIIKYIWSFAGLIGPYLLYIHTHTAASLFSQAQRHNVTVSMSGFSEVRVYPQATHTFYFFFPQRGNDLHLCHISTGLHTLVTHFLLLQRKSVCKVFGSE